MFQTKHNVFIRNCKKYFGGRYFLHKFVEVITRRIAPINNIIPDDF